MNKTTKTVIITVAFCAILFGFAYAKADGASLFSTSLTINSSVHVSKFTDPSNGATCYITTDNPARMNAISCITGTISAPTPTQGTQVGPNLIRLN